MPTGQMNWNAHGTLQRGKKRAALKTQLGALSWNAVGMLINIQYEGYKVSNIAMAGAQYKCPGVHPDLAGHQLHGGNKHRWLRVLFVRSTTFTMI